VRTLTNDYPNISRAFLRLTQIEAAISRQWLLNVGHRGSCCCGTSPRVDARHSVVRLVAPAPRLRHFAMLFGQHG